MATLVGGWEVNLTVLQYNFDLYCFYWGIWGIWGIMYGHGMLVQSFSNKTRFYISVGQLKMIKTQCQI